MTIKSDAEKYAESAIRRWNGSVESVDLANVIVKSKEEQREMDCKVLCVYCSGDGYAPANRDKYGVWTHIASNEHYSPENPKCEANELREAWWYKSALTLEQISDECVSSILHDMSDRDGWDEFWGGCGENAKSEIILEWGRLIEKAIITYQNEGLK